MPVYEYECQQCGRVAEIFLRSTEDQAVCCPGCGSKSMEKLVSASYLVKTDGRSPGKTCCGREERCETPPCSKDNGCHRR